MNKTISSFENNGFQKLNVIDKQKAEELNDYLKKKFKVNKSIFLDEKKFIKDQKKKKKFYQSNVLDNYDTSFIFKNKKFKEAIEKILGKNYIIEQKKVICSLPLKYYPKWIDKYKKKDIPNLTVYLKPHYRSLRFFLGTDYHQDFMDHPKCKANYITVYIYLDKVGKNLSPLKILPKTHLGGADLYPHKLDKKGLRLIYKARNGRNIKTKPKYILGEAGTTWFWHTCLLHGTSYNLKSTPRYSVRLILKKKKGSKGIIDQINKKIPNVVAYKKMFL